jgi:hypothetical protein
VVVAEGFGGVVAVVEPREEWLVEGKLRVGWVTVSLNYLKLEHHGDRI